MASTLHEARTMDVPPHQSAGSADWVFFRRLLLTAAVAAAAYAVWQISGVLILVFAAVLMSVLLGGLADALAAHTLLTRRWALFAVVVGGLVLLTGSLLLFGAQLVGQMGDVFSRIPRALDSFGSQLGIPDASQRLEAAISSRSGGLLSRLSSMGYTLIGALTDLLLVIVAAVFLAADPNLYRRSVWKLFSHNQHARVVATMDAMATALRLWFLGQLVSMILVGVLSGIAFWLIGLPSAIGLGTIAGLTNFVPMIGPIVGAVPALLVAFSQDMTAALWAAAAILIIQQLDGNLLMPLVQRRAVDLPPAVVLFAIVSFGALFGVLGVILAVPLAVVLMVFVQKVWIRAVLGEKTAVSGETDAES